MGFVDSSCNPQTPHSSRKELPKICLEPSYIPATACGFPCQHHFARIIPEARRFAYLLGSRGCSPKLFISL